MNKSYAALLPGLAVFAFVIAQPGASWAEWPRNGAAVCEESGGQVEVQILDIPDGGAILTWSDGRNGNLDIYAQRIDEWGRPLWAAGGVAVCTNDSLQYTPQLATDLLGGAIITWYDKRSGNWDVYAQRIDAEGTPLWTSDGVAVAATAGDQVEALIVSDEEGGAIIAWRDTRVGDSDIYAQRLNSSGTPQWISNGVAVTTATDEQMISAMIQDGAGGAVIAWGDYQNEIFVSDVYVQRIDASGSGLWALNGVALCVQSGMQWPTTLVPDGMGGAVVTWEDYRGSSQDIYSQRVDGEGVAQWTAHGVAVCAASGVQQDPESIRSSTGEGFIIAWLDKRTGNGEIYAQMIDLSGTAHWTADGEPVSTGAWERICVGLVSDGAGGAIVTWAGEQLGTDDIYANRIDSEGALVWSPEDVPLCTASGTQTMPVAVADGAGGAIAAWMDGRTGGWDAYAQRITRQGYWGLPAPTIASITDIEGDQGGQVWIKFEASRLDTWQTAGVDYYSIWRDAAPPEAAQIAEAASLDPGNPASQGAVGASAFARAPGEAKRPAHYLSPYGYWELVGTVDAHYLATYGFTAETTRDSTGVDPGIENFFVSAHGSSGVDWWDSAPAEGYSVDNLAPCMPQGVAGDYAGGQSLWIHWNPNTEIDLHHYAIYRGTSPGFVPDETNLIGTATDTSLVDTGYGYGDEYYYKISAWDVHENESPFALLSPDMITGVPGGGRAHPNALFQNTPNPFSASTRITFSLNVQGHVRLLVFDAKGRLVSTLVDSELAPDEYALAWDGAGASGRPMPAGTYFYRIEAPGWSDVKKMTLAR